MKITLNKCIINIFYILLLGAPLILKAVHVDNFIFLNTGTRWFGATQVLINDSIIYFSLLVLLYLSFLTIFSRFLSIMLRVLAFLVFCLYFLDYIIIANFNTHLIFIDVIKYFSYSFKYFQQIYGLYFVLIVGLIILVLTAIFVFTNYKIKNKILHVLIVMMILSLLLTSCLNNHSKYVHSWIYKNVLNYNLTVLSETKEYSKEFIDAFNFEDKKYCSPKTAEHPNIIILMVESLSSYQSKFFSGIRDWTPNLDLIASRNVSFKNFYANGFTTEDAEISLLTGQLPIYPPSIYANGSGVFFNNFHEAKKSLPNILKQQGYTTAFLTTADLEFADTGFWAKSIGFDYIEGHEHPYYDNWNRFHFKAAPDKALYNRVFDRIEHNLNRKYFLFIKTVSSHHPYINPENKKKSESESFLYVDRQLGLFYKRLKKKGYFNNGILIIVGDHHSMVPLKKEEYDVFGSLKAAAKIPMIISFGDKKPSIVYKQYQQIDIFNSLKNLISNTQCYSDWIGDVFSQGKHSAKYIAHRRGDNRNIISVFSGDKNYLIKLDGDRTRTVNKSIDKVTRELIVKRINASRISRDKKKETK